MESTLFYKAIPIIAGDFNKMKLGTLCNCFDLRKIVKKPTRQNNTLDQIMTNMSPLFQEVQHLPPLGRSDHQCLLLNPKHRTSTRPITKTFRSMKRSNLRGSPCKNRPLEFLKNTEFLQTFCVEEVIHKMNKKR